MADQIHVALIDDDAAVRDSLQIYFTRQRVTTTCFASAEEFLAAGSESFDCIVTDVRMPRMTGLDLVRHLIGQGSMRPIILITGHGNVDMAVTAVKAGAFDFIESPMTRTACLPASIAQWRRRASTRMRRRSSKRCKPVCSYCPRDSVR